MNWNAVGAVGQILGSLATFVTVGYLVIQVHDTEAEMKRSLAQNRVERNIQLNIPLITDERLAALHTKINKSKRGELPLPPFMDAAIKEFGLTEEEALSLHIEQLTRWNARVLTVAHVDELPPGEREEFDAGNRGETAEPLFQYWYKLTKASLNPNTVRYIDSLMPQPLTATASKAEGTR